MSLGKTLGNVFKNITKGGLAVADAGGKIGIPVLTQIDAVADTVKEIKGKRKVDEEAITKIVTDLQALKEAVPTAVPEPKSLLQSNRFKAALLAAVTSIGAHYGLNDPVLADAITEVVFYLASAFILGDTIRPSVKTASK